MRRNFGHPGVLLSAGQHEELLELLSNVGLDIVQQAKGPVPLLTFGRRVLERISGPGAPVALPHLPTP